MKKLVVVAGAVALVAAGYTGISWYVGVQAEDAIRGAVQQANERIIKTLGPDLGTLGATIEISEYRRGVFASEARYRIVVQDGDERIELGMDDHTQHGPFPWDRLTQGEFAPLLAHSRSRLVDTEIVKRWFDAARGAMPLEVDTRIGFGGNGISVWNFAPLEWAAPGERLSFSGGRMEVRFSNNFADSTATGRFDAFTVGTGPEGENFTLKDIRLRSQTATGADGTVQVDSELVTASLVVQEMAEETLVVDQLVVTLASRQHAALLDATLRYDLGRVHVGEVDLGSLTIGGDIERLNIEAFAAMLAEYDAIAREHAADNGEDFELTTEDEQRMLARLLPVLASHPAAALRPVVWRNDKGESTLAIMAAFQPASEAGSEQYNDPLAGALRELRVELVLSRPMFVQAFVQAGGDQAGSQQMEMLAALMFDQYVGQLESEGLLRREGDLARATIIYNSQAAAVDVNGHQMSLQDFMERFSTLFM